ncbi:hypothetical protein GDO78_016875 [Eleutherodactylus coqui]|uniref:Uncharacterized protein n=1 Tax=Eleutherodactylus coqui TaxID=57060 RepID=A0A8J6EA87_ELECQ|nr:hypothetical protein GDO78_016875 [Eleutherodactylus coqui]
MSGAHNQSPISREPEVTRCGVRRTLKSCTRPTPKQELQTLHNAVCSVTEQNVIFVNMNGRFCNVSAIPTTRTSANKKRKV